MIDFFFENGKMKKENIALQKMRLACSVVD